jgi:hypothetical protein
VIERALSDGSQTSAVAWTTRTKDPTVAGGELLRRRETHFFAGSQNWMLRVEADFAAGSNDDSEEALARFLSELELATSLGRDWYEEKMEFKAPLKFNLGFSVATSLAFALAMLGIASWRLTRIDF